MEAFLISFQTSDARNFADMTFDEVVYMLCFNTKFLHFKGAAKLLTEFSTSPKYSKIVNILKL